jgi:hypothetical protein
MSGKNRNKLKKKSDEAKVAFLFVVIQGVTFATTTKICIQTYELLWLS